MISTIFDNLNPHLQENKKQKTHCLQFLIWYVGSSPPNHAKYLLKIALMAISIGWSSLITKCFSIEMINSR